MSNRIYRDSSIMATFIEVVDASDFGDKIVELAKKGGNDITLTQCKKDGVIFKTKRECTLDEDAVRKLVASSMITLINEDPETFKSEINDRYEIAFDKKCVDTDLVANVTNVTKHGKCFYVEIDIK